MADDFSYSNINESESSTDENEVIGSAHGLSIFTCSLFIIAEMAGSGILALPKAVSEAGWTGLFLLIFSCLLSLYCGILLGNCWMSVRTQNKRYQGHVRDPYPVIGFEAAGKPGRIIVEICVLITLFGVCVVFLLLASQQISSLIDADIGDFTVKNEFRLWVLICGLALLPFTWLATPKDIWPFAIAASACTIFAAIFICVRTGMYIHNHGVSKYSEQSHATAKSLFNAFGTIAFSFGGASVFPNFQADMRKPSKFKYAASVAFIFVLIMYIPVATLPYLAFGSNVNDDVLRTLKGLDGNGKTFVKLAEALITFHLLFTLVITINPITQLIEEYMKLPHKFGWRRILLRTAIVLFIITVAEALPNFGPILSFIGGSTVTMMAFILPCIFYLRLKAIVALHIKVLHAEIILLALVFGTAATYTAVTHLQNPFKS